MKIKTIILLGTLLTLLLILTACASSANSTSPTTAPSNSSAPTSVGALDGKTLVQERCTVCHTINRIESAKKTADQWKTTVELMIQKGAQLNADEETAVIDYLAKTYPK